MKIFKDGYSMTCSDALLQDHHPSWQRIFFLISILNLLTCNLELLSLVLSSVTNKRVCLHYLFNCPSGSRTLQLSPHFMAFLPLLLIRPMPQDFNYPSSLFSCPLHFFNILLDREVKTQRFIPSVTSPVPSREE